MNSRRRYPCALALAFAALICAAAPAAQAKPASFSRWAAQWDARQTSYLGPPMLNCVLKFPHNEKRAGACLAGFLARAWPKLNAEWKHDVARIARGQSPACQAAISAYRPTEQRNGEVRTAYYRSHLHIGLHAMTTAVAQAPFTTLNAALRRALGHAIAVCG